MNATSILEQYRISDFLEWDERKTLKLNPDFQRRSVWTIQARAALIDTILRQLPVPKVYIRTQIDAATKRSFREVVDGQQRLRAIIDFSKDKFALTQRCKEFAGLKYSTLTPDLADRFLTYPVAVDQLINASDSDVLEVFSRLNSYNVALNPAELRHAEFQGNFKWAVHESAKHWSALWEDLGVVSVRDRLRMADDSLIAEIFGVLLKGVTDGGAPRIRKLYSEFDASFPQEEDTRRALDDVLQFITTNLGPDIQNTPLSRAPHFLMLAAAIAHARHGIPDGAIGGTMPARSAEVLSDLDRVRSQLLTLASVLEQPQAPVEYQDFWAASRGSTQRIAGRKIRFLTIYRALKTPTE